MKSSHMDFRFRIFSISLLWVFLDFLEGKSHVCCASLIKFCLARAVQREAPKNMAPFSILRDPQLHSHWPSYSHCSCCTVKRRDKQTNKSSAHCGSLKRQSHKVSDGQNKNEWIIPQPKIISLRGPWRKKKMEKKISLKCSRWCELRLMQMNVYLQVKIKDLGSHLVYHLRVKQHTNDWCSFSSPLQH